MVVHLILVIRGNDVGTCFVMAPTEITNYNKANNYSCYRINFVYSYKWSHKAIPYHDYITVLKNYYSSGLK